MKNSLLILFFLMCYVHVIKAEIVEKNESKVLFQDMLYLNELIADSLGRVDFKEKVSDLSLKLGLMDEEDFSVFINYEILTTVHYKIKSLLVQAEKYVLSKSINKQVEFPDATPIPECINADPVLAEIALSAKLLAEEVLAYAKWECEETVLGENSALACLAPEVLAALAAAEFEFVEFCLSNKGESNIEANLETTQSVGEHLNEFIDETITSRSTQDSVDDVQGSVDGVQDSVNTANDTLNLLDTNLDTALSDLEQANALLANIYSQAESLLFRTQVNQIEIEGIEIITSDIQQQAQEIRDDTQSLILSNQLQQVQFLVLHQQTQAMVTESNNNQLEFILSRATAKAPLVYQLPMSKGGKLEQVREVVADKLFKIASLGGRVSEAQALLALGDSNYNTGKYKLAYGNYSGAYKSLLRSSF